MKRFKFREKEYSRSRILISICVFAVVIAVVIFGSASLSKGSAKRQKESLENALSRAILYCYSLEGRYPESLDYITENYNVTYNTDQFYVDYRVTGANIYPDVTVIEIGGGS